VRGGCELSKLGRDCFPKEMSKVQTHRERQTVSLLGVSILGHCGLKYR